MLIGIDKAPPGSLGVEIPESNRHDSSLPTKIDTLPTGVQVLYYVVVRVEYTVLHEFVKDR